MFSRLSSSSTAASVKNFKICLDSLPNGSDLYYPGDAVQGAVLFAVSAAGRSNDDQGVSPAKFRCISISFKGEAVFHAKERADATICHQISYLKLPDSCDTVPTNLNDGSVLYKSIAPGFLAPGQYALPFCFTIPKDAPGSTTQYKGVPMQIGVHYTLDARLNLVGSLDKTHSQSVMVTTAMSQEQFSMESSHLSEFPATLPMSAMFGSNGVVEVVAKMKGRVLCGTEKEQGLAITVDVNSCGDKAIDGATVELQKVTQIDHWRKGHFSHHEKQYSDRAGDLRFCNKFRTLAPSKNVVTDAEALEHNRPEYEHSGMGTASNGYVVSNGVPLRSSSFARTVSRTNLFLRNTSGSACNGGTKLPPGSTGTFVGTVTLKTQELALPTLRMDKIQRNYRVMIRLGGVAKSICLPVVVVSDLISNPQQESEGFQLPWMHHEKVFRTLCSHEKTEVPAPSTDSALGVVEGTVVAADDSEMEQYVERLPSYEEAVLGVTVDSHQKQSPVSFPPPPAYGIQQEGLTSSDDEGENGDEETTRVAHPLPGTTPADDEVAAYYRSLGYNSL